MAKTFKPGAQIYIADSVGFSNTLTRIAARAARDLYIGQLKKKLEYEPERTGRLYKKVHPTYGDYHASKPGSGLTSEYPAWFTGRLRESIQGNIDRSSRIRSYTVGSDVPYIVPLTDGWETENGAQIAPRKFFERHALEERDRIERIIQAPFRSLGRKKKGDTRSVFARRKEIILNELSLQTDISNALLRTYDQMELDALMEELGQDDSLASFSQKLKVRILNF